MITFTVDEDIIFEMNLKEIILEFVNYCGNGDTTHQFANYCGIGDTIQ
jgi:hypothetical protein